MCALLSPISMCMIGPETLHPDHMPCSALPCRRARASKQAYEAWFDKARDRPTSARGEFDSGIDWSKHEWSGDGLGSLMVSHWAGTE